VLQLGQEIDIMATISSVGIGSGLDVKSIVTQLVALEKQPLKSLQVKASNFEAQVSAFAQIQSQFSALSDVAKRISATGAWAARNASSSNTAAATVSVTASAAATSFTLDVDALAKAQTVSSAPLAAGQSVGSGTLTLQLGTWSGNGASFAAASTGPVEVTITAVDTVASIATKINAAGAGVTATAFFDGTQDRLVLTSKATGVAAGFRMQVTDGDGGLPNDETGLSRLAFDPQAGANGMAQAGNLPEYGQNAQARINGLAVTSASNTLDSNIPGVTIKLVATTTTGYGTPGELKSSVTMNISEDVTVAVKNVSDFVTAYNALNATLSDLTKYDAATKTAALFQGDSSIVGLQSVLRNMASSNSEGGGAYQRLSDVGLERQFDGSLVINTAKLSAAANGGAGLQDLFTKNNSNPLTNGFALKFDTLASGVLASSGAVTNKAAALQRELQRNADAQDKVNERAAVVEARLNKQYSALDARMAQLTALNAFVAQQVTLWNNAGRSN
jgi:flagellar hook-associated protein 2